MVVRWLKPSAIISLAPDLPMSSPQVSAGSMSASRKPCAFSMRNCLISFAGFMVLRFHGILPLGKVRAKPGRPAASLVISARRIDLAAEHPIGVRHVGDDDRHQDQRSDEEKPEALVRRRGLPE